MLRDPGRSVRDLHRLSLPLAQPPIFVIRVNLWRIGVRRESETGRRVLAGSGVVLPVSGLLSARMAAMMAGVAGVMAA